MGRAEELLTFPEPQSVHAWNGGSGTEEAEKGDTNVEGPARAT